MFRFNARLVCLAVFLVLVVEIRTAEAMFFKTIFDSWYTAHECEGACQLSMSCWMNGGRVSGTCGGLVYVCCNYEHLAESDNETSGRDGQYAEPRLLTDWPGIEDNSIDIVHDISFGKVRNDATCGYQKIARRRVVGGSAAGFGTFPWQALIRIGNNSRCGGALISRQHVVTAGHCVQEIAAASKDGLYPPLGLRVYLGEYRLYSKTEPLPRQRFSVSSLHMHPYYKFTPQADLFDVAVLRLSRPVTYQPHIGPICLPYKNEYFEEDTHAMVAGWGATDPKSNTRPTYLQAVDVKVVDSRRCETWHRRNKIKVFGICSGSILR